MTRQVEKIKQLFAAIPPDYEQIIRILAEENFSKRELTEIALDVIGECEGEYSELHNPRFESVTEDTLHSPFLLNSLHLLLQHGLDPNDWLEDEEENVMWETQWIDYPDTGAAVMRLLLEYGGNPNLRLSEKTESLFEDIDFKVAFDDFDGWYHNIVQCWLVLMAFGGCWSDGDIPLIMLGNNDVSIFKKFEKIDFWLTPLPPGPGLHNPCIMHIFNTETGEEVAMFRR